MWRDANSCMIASRHPRVLLEQQDFHAVLVIALLDIGMAMTGITTGQTPELNPLYALFTSSVLLMAIGAVLYIGILAVASITVTGNPRKALASLIFGIHLAGTAAGIKFLFPYLGGSLHMFWFTLIAASGAALFYYTENVLNPTTPPNTSDE